MDGIAAEGGADCWSRPSAPKINPQKDSISACYARCFIDVSSSQLLSVFQQIDVEDAYDGPTPTFRMYGTTEVTVPL